MKDIYRLKMRQVLTSDKNKRSVIIIHTPLCFLGYGDSLFSIKVAKILKELLIELNYDGELLFVTDKAWLKNTFKNYLKEYAITPIDVTTYYSWLRQKLIKVDYYIHGPITQKFLVTPTTTRIILISEYSDLDYLQPLPFIQASHKHLQQRRITLFRTGFPFPHHPQANLHGIFFSESLMQLTTDKMQAWDHLETLATTLFQSNIANYYQTTELFFEYAHYSGNSELYYRTNSHLHFLRVHSEFTHASTLNQDIISLGIKLQYKKMALEAMLPLLIKRGYSQISFIDLNNNETHILFDAKQAGRKYRLFSLEKVPHQQFLALLTVSSDLVGVTGDQSLSEALSARKVIVYECMSWKADFILSYCQILQELTHDAEIKELATLLITSQSEADYQRLRELLQDKNRLQILKASADLIYRKYNLNTALKAFFKREISVLKLRKLEDFLYAIGVWMRKRWRLVVAHSTRHYERSEAIQADLDCFATLAMTSVMRNDDDDSYSQ